MKNILENDAAVTTTRRANLVKWVGSIGYQYTLPKEVDGLFSVYAVHFAVNNGTPDLSKPLNAAFFYLAEVRGDKTEAARRIKEHKRYPLPLPTGYWLVHHKDGTDQAYKVA